MPHSGGRVGRGLYFASENAKSASYVRCIGDTGIMLLNEVVLGKEHFITRDDSSLITPPKGFNSVIAKGQTEPNPNQDVEMMIDGKKVVVPQGKPINQPAYSNSSFMHSEYLVYKENQVRIRYLLKLKFKFKLFFKQLFLTHSIHKCMYSNFQLMNSIQTFFQGIGSVLRLHGDIGIFFLQQLLLMGHSILDHMAFVARNNTHIGKSLLQHILQWMEDLL